MADNQVDIAELERITNEDEGWKLQTPEGEQPNPETQPQTSEQQPTESAPTVSPATPAPAEQSKAAVIPDEVLKVLEETPFKTIPDIVKGYKNSQSEFTKLNERVKPYEQLLNDVSADAGLRQFIDQAVQLYRNPQLAQAYAQPQQGAGEPNPANYDFSTFEGIAQFQKDTIAHAQKAAFETVNQRMSSWEQKQALEKSKLEFSREFPDVNVDEVLGFVNERNGKWTLQDAYKIKNYENLKSQIYEQARKELTAKVNEAAKNAPASSAPSDKPAVSNSEIMQHIARYGHEAANKRWGAEKVQTALRKFTEENEG